MNYLLGSSHLTALSDWLILLGLERSGVRLDSRPLTIFSMLLSSLELAAAVAGVESPEVDLGEWRREAVESGEEEADLCLEDCTGGGLEEARDLGCTVSKADPVEREERVLGGRLSGSGYGEKRWLLAALRWWAAVAWWWAVERP